MDPSLPLGIVMCVILSAYFSAAETALVSLPAVTVHRIAQEKSLFNIHLWQKYPTRMLITILIGNNIVNIGAASFATLLANELFAHAGTAISIGVMTFIILVTGEIFPKSIARNHALTLLRYIMPPLTVVYYLLYPFSSIFQAMLFLKKREDLKELFTLRDLHHFITTATQVGKIQEKHAQMLLATLALREVQVREIMVPRPKVVLFNLTTPREEVKKMFLSTGFSRLPAYRDRPDNIVGILHAKNLLADEKEPLEKLLKPAHFIPENKRIYSLLQTMQAQRFHMGIVVDEFGSFVGIITLEDILEEIVGEIEDEYDMESPAKVQPLEDGSFLLDGSLPLYVVNRRLKTTFPMTGDYETLAGFVVAELGYIPKKGESLVREGWELIIQEVTPKQVLQIVAKPKAVENEG